MDESKSKDRTLKDLVFEEVAEEDFFAAYTGGCSGGRSDCCTRVCTRNGAVASEEEWGKFLAVEGGVIQY
ncbi:MAG: hypothetical protein LIV25_05100 [Olsenella sp.]|nr:hypothetical protein [Olsenella sp.]